MTGRRSRCYGALPDSRQLPTAARTPASPVRDRGPTPTRPSRDPDRTTARYASSATRTTDLNSSIVVLMENHRNGLGTEGGYIVSMEGRRRAARRSEPGGKSGPANREVRAAGMARKQRRLSPSGRVIHRRKAGGSCTPLASCDAVKKRPNGYNPMKYLTNSACKKARKCTFLHAIDFR